MLWLFTDAARLPDPLPAIARLPPGLCGVVFRHDAAPARAALGRRVARLCRTRRLALVVAGDVRLAAELGAGVHLRDGAWPGVLRVRGLRTASAHGPAALRRAAAAKASIIFLSAAFPTASHPGARALGAVRWAGLARRGPGGGPGPSYYGLGGVGGDNIRRLGRRCAGAGAVSGLL